MRLLLAAGLPARWTCAIALVALLTAGSALAQSEYGSRINRTPGAVGDIDRFDEDAARRVMNTYGRCVARNRGRLAREILAMPLMSPEQTRRVNGIFQGDDPCLGTGDRRLEFAALLVVGPMAEEFILSEHRHLNEIAGMSDARMAELGLSPRTGYEDFALCIARRAPRDALTLAETTPATPAESVAINTLRPHLGPCLPQGGGFTFNRSSLRALVSAGLYRALSILRAAQGRPDGSGP